MLYLLIFTITTLTTYHTPLLAMYFVLFVSYYYLSPTTTATFDFPQQQPASSSMRIMRAIGRIYKQHDHDRFIRQCSRLFSRARIGNIIDFIFSIIHTMLMFLNQYAWAWVGLRA